MGNTADSVKLEVFSDPHDKAGNEAALVAQAAEFFGHDRATHTGFRHDPTGPEGLRTSAIFYDDTPYVGR